MSLELVSVRGDYQNFEISVSSLEQLLRVEDLELALCIDGNELYSPSGIKKNTVILNGMPYVFYHQNFEFLDPPQRGSPTSQAFYLARHLKKGYLLQYIPPNSKTSKHYHATKTETFLNLDGRVTIAYHEVGAHLENKRILSRDFMTLLPSNWHQLITDELVAITLLHIDPPDLSWNDHVYQGD